MAFCGVAFSELGRERGAKALAAAVSMSLLSGCVVYGVDDRTDIYQNENPQVLVNAAASGALIRKAALVEGKHGYRLARQVKTLGEKERLCRSETFRKQPAAAFCTGTLVAPDKFVSAAHCFEDEYLDDLYVVFDYEYASQRNSRKKLRLSQVYEITDEVSQLDETHDYAVLTLSTPVVGRTPAKVRTGGRIADGQTIYVIGHPSGLPKKVAGLARGGKGAGARVLENASETYFYTNLDTFHGNSGGGVFNAETHEQEGILIAGAPDYVLRRGEKCRRVNRCSEGGESCDSDYLPSEDDDGRIREKVMRISEVSPAEMTPAR